MNLTEKDNNLFKLLNDSEMGAQLCDYLERLLNHTCDARNMGPEDTKESVKKAAQTIQTHIIDKIKKRSKIQRPPLNQHE